MIEQQKKSVKIEVPLVEILKESINPLLEALKTNVKATNLIQQWADKQGHDRCWYYPELFRELADLFGVKVADPGLPPEKEFEAGCERYRKEEYAGQKRLASLAKPE